MKSYRELDIYNESKRFAIEVHKMTPALPKFELYEEGGQVRRSSKSVTALFETESLADKAKYDDLHNKFDLLSKRINKFIRWAKENWNEFPSPETGNL